ncbi:unnamed protein product [Ectocarpus sp. 4 AP-2014]
MDLPNLEFSLASWTLVALAALSAITLGKVGLGMLRAYYILRVRAGLPVVLWYPKFWRMDGRRQKGSSLSRVLKRMEVLEGPHGMYGTVFGTQAVVHVADPEAAALNRKLCCSTPPPLAQHTKRPGYDHFGSFFGRGVFTADGEEWRKKRATVAHALFRGGAVTASDGGLAGSRGVVSGDVGGGRGATGGSGKALAVLANEEADSLLREMETLREEGGELEVEVVRLLQRHTLNLVHRFLCGGEDVCASPERKHLLSRYLDAVTDMRMVILARSRSVWMFAWGWVYRAFSPFHARETKNMLPIREFAELVIETAVADGGRNQPEHGVRCTDGNSRDTAEGSSDGDTTVTNSSTSRRANRVEGATGREAVSAPIEEGTREEGIGKAAGGRSGENAPKTALFNMAARESHRAYPGSMVDETITLLFAGQDTSAATLSWTMHLLSLPENRPHLLEVHREVLAAVGSPDGYVDCAGGGGGGFTAPATRDHNEKDRQQRRPLLPMVDACIRESQRLYPVAPFVVRHLSTDLRLKDGTLLPAGALACVWIYGLHRHPALWKSPDKFLPERWLNGARQPAGSFIPYASGPRGCVGRPFAGVALRILLARICLALDFSPAVDESGVAGSQGAVDAGLTKDMQAGFTVLPGGGVHLRLRKWE